MGHVAEVVVDGTTEIETVPLLAVSEFGMMRLGGIAGRQATEGGVGTGIVGGIGVAHGIGRMNLREACVVKEIESAPRQRDAKVVGGIVAYLADTDVALGLFKATLAARHKETLAIGVIQGAPDHDVKVEETFTEEDVATPLAIAATATAQVDAIHIDALFGDDIDDRRQGHTTIERRCRTTQHLYLLDLVE